MSNAPVCNVPTGPLISDQPGLQKFLAIPQANNLNSALVAINAMRQIIMQLIGMVPIQPVSADQTPSLNLGVLGGQGFGLGASGAGGSTKVPQNNNQQNQQQGQGRFVEDRSRRVTNKKRIYQDNDNTSPNYVDIKEIDQVVWVDQLTGQTIVWQR